MIRNISIAVIFFILFNMTTAFASKKVIELGIDQAVEIGIEKSIVLKKIKNEIELSEVASKKAENAQEKLSDSKEKIKESSSKLSSAETAIDNGIAPVNIEAEIPGVGEVVIPAGTSIDRFIEDSLGISGETKEELKNNIVSGVKSDINNKKSFLNLGENKLDEALVEAGVNISDSLDLNSFDSLNVNATGDLLTTMANVSLEVTKASYDIYTNKIALLIKNSYYDVLKAKNILRVKEKALNRAKVQFDFAKLSYEEGMKAKDDMILGEIYYKSKEIEYEKARGEYINAMTELKKNIGIDLDKEVVVLDVLSNKVTDESIEEGLASGMKNRLEIKKSLGEVLIYDLNLRLVSKKYPEITFQYQEAFLKDQKARLNYESKKLDVENSIRQSYERLNSVSKMLELSKEMVKKAEESLEIAEYKYKEGFGTDSSLLKQLNLESSAGTIIEVLAAEESLAEVEEKVVEITYSYNLAREKYYNDIAKLNY